LELKVSTIDKIAGFVDVNANAHKNPCICASEGGSNEWGVEAGDGEGLEDEL
jgi:hypothetical protein